jgi:DNA (cytosine-5)-methyltransferase 1
MHSNNKTVMEFFAGIGLFRLGLEASGWSCALANDISVDKAETYRSNFGDDQLVVGDIWELDPRTIPTALAATASFPCTDLSLAGERRGLQGNESGTVGAFLKILGSLASENRAPKIVVLENVTGLLTSHGGNDVRSLVEELNSLNYVVDILQIDAIHFLPQSRARVFLIGVAADQASLAFDLDSGSASLLDFSSILDTQHPCRPPAIVRTIRRNEHCHWGLRALPPLPVRKLDVDQLIDDSENAREMEWGDDKVTKLLGQMSKKHLEVLDDWRRTGGHHVGTVYRRVRNGGSRAELRSDGVAGCLRTPKGGSSKQIVVMMDSGKISIRFMTAREYARLMGVPDDFVQSPNYIKALFGYGDAVCVPVIEWLDAAYLSPIATAIADAAASD